MMKRTSASNHSASIVVAIVIVSQLIVQTGCGGEAEEFRISEGEAALRLQNPYTTRFVLAGASKEQQSHTLNAFLDSLTNEIDGRDDSEGIVYRSWLSRDSRSIVILAERAAWGSELKTEFRVITADLWQRSDQSQGSERVTLECTFVWGGQHNSDGINAASRIYERLRGAVRTLSLSPEFDDVVDV